MCIINLQNTEEKLLKFTKFPSLYLAEVGFLDTEKVNFINYVLK